MARGKIRDRKFAFWRDGAGFMKEPGVFTLNADDAQVFLNTSEVRAAIKAFANIKMPEMKVVEFPVIKDCKRKASAIE